MTFSSGGVQSLRFVVLHHTAWNGREDHYDLLLEAREGGGQEERDLMAFATLSDEFPDGRSHADFRARGRMAGNPLAKANLMKLLGNHRRWYLSYEGHLSGERGKVVRVDEGRVRWKDVPEVEFQSCIFELQGSKLNGEYKLRHMGSGTYSLERLKRQ